MNKVFKNFILILQIDMEDVWRGFSDQGVPEEDLRLYKNVFSIIDSHGELGIRLIDLSVSIQIYVSF